MRRQSFYLIVLSMFLLVLPISKDGRVNFGVADYISDISYFLRISLDPMFASVPIEDKVLAAILIVQAVGWIAFAVCLLLVAVLAMVRNRNPLKPAAILSAVVLIHGVLEVALAVSFSSVEIANAIFTRFGVDLSDLVDDYDALLNSSIVPLGLIVWYFLNKRFTAVTTPQDVASISSENLTQNS